MVSNWAGVVAVGLLLLTTWKPVALGATSYDECKISRSARSDTLELMDNRDGSDCLTIEHPIRLSGQTFRRETRLLFVCNGGQCPEFICHDCTFEGLLRLGYSKSRERGKLDLDESTIAGLKLGNSLFLADVSLKGVNVIRWIDGDGAQFEAFDVRSLHAAAVDLPKCRFNGLVTLAGVRIDGSIHLASSIFTDEVDANGLKAGAAIDLSGVHFIADLTARSDQAAHDDCSCGGNPCPQGTGGDPWKTGRATNPNICQSIEFANVRAEELVLDDAIAERSVAIALSTFSHQLSMRNFHFSSTLDLNRTSAHAIDVLNIEPTTPIGSGSIWLDDLRVEYVLDTSDVQGVSKLAQRNSRSMNALLPLEAALTKHGLVDAASTVFLIRLGASPSLLTRIGAWVTGYGRFSPGSYLAVFILLCFVGGFILYDERFMLNFGKDTIHVESGVESANNHAPPTRPRPSATRYVNRVFLTLELMLPSIFNFGAGARDNVKLRLNDKPLLVSFLVRFYLLLCWAVVALLVYSIALRLVS
jgi:hypothetical protein